MNQPDLYRRPDKSAQFLNFHGLNPYFTKEWNRHWTNEGAEIEQHKNPKRILRNLIEAQSFENIVLHQLETHERRIICRIITGKVGLNGYLFNIKRSPTPNCNWCEDEEETVEHFLMECLHYSGLRNIWCAAVNSLMPLINFETTNFRILVVGDKTWEPEIRIKVVKELVKFVVGSGRKF